MREVAVDLTVCDGGASYLSADATPLLGVETEVLWSHGINLGLTGFWDLGPTEHQGRCTDATIAAIVASGEVFFTGTTWRSKRAMRVSVCNWQTSESDVARAIAAARSALMV